MTTTTMEGGTWRKKNTSWCLNKFLCL
jgi:hypothetical protein